MHWLLGLAEHAQTVLEAAFDAGPRSAMQRYKAQASALSRFAGGLRGGKKPLFPELAVGDLNSEVQHQWLRINES